MKAKYYYVLLNHKGGLLLIDGRLPIYWKKAVAQADFDKYKAGEIRRINHYALMELIHDSPASL